MAELLDKKSYLPMARYVMRNYFFPALDMGDVESAAAFAYTNSKRNFKDGAGTWATYFYVAMRNELMKANLDKQGYGMKQGRYVSIFPMSLTFVKTDSPNGHEDEAVQGERDVEAETLDPDIRLDFEVISQLLVESLGQRNANIYIWRTADGLHMQEIADKVGVSRQRIAQILDEVEPFVAQIRTKLQKEITR